MIIVPPLNFALVSDGIYRSGYPNKKNYEFLKSLDLKSVLYLCDDEYSQEYAEFFANVNVFHIPLQAAKEPFLELDSDAMTQALSIVLDTRNHPILIHCNKGKHRIGVLVACIRKLENWSLASTLQSLIIGILDEYKRFSGLKLRMDDQEVIMIIIIMKIVYSSI